MRALLLASLLASPAAAQTIVTQYITGTITPRATPDYYGLFGPPGASLAGQPITLFFSYDTRLFPTGKQCINPCDVAAMVGHDTPAATLVSVTINGHHHSWSPVSEGVLRFQGNDLDVSADRNLFALDGADIGVSYASPPAFGQKLSPENPPVHTVEDFVNIYLAGQDVPETLTFAVTGSTR